MKQAINQVHNFHTVFKLPIQTHLGLPGNEERALRLNLLTEEFREYVEGEISNNIVEIADGLADMVYIIAGTALAYGIPLAEVFDEVHRSNMTKLDDHGNPMFREDGKILKGPNYMPPNIKKILNETS